MFNSSEKKWTQETCYKEAQKYEYKIDFITKSSGAYEAAYKNGWINDYVWLKSTKGVNQHPNFQKAIVQLTKDGQFVAKFESCSKCPNNFDSRYITRCCTHEKETAYGYIWMYEEVYNLIQNGLSWKEAMNKFSPKKKEILQFDLNWNFIRE